VKPKVYFTDTKTSLSVNLFDKLEHLIKESGILNLIKPGQFVAIKTHFGEEGVNTFVSPLFVRKIVELVESCGGLAFLTDTNALYRGARMNAIDHIKLAHWHGFNFAPIIIADGLNSQDYVEISISGKYYKKIKIAKAIAESDTVIVVSHFKGHLVSGFGGAIKNLGMGCVPKESKLIMHSNTHPYIAESKCTGCGICREHCPQDAIVIDSVAKILDERCIGCTGCIGVCPQRAIRIKWADAGRELCEKIAEHALGVTKLVKRIGYINFLIDITPLCDCAGTSQPPFVPNIGILAGFDPVAIDKASYDLVLKAPPLYPELKGDYFKKLNPMSEPLAQIEHGEKIGLGIASYELVKVEPPRKKNED